LADTEILVSADLEGYLHFWCVSIPHHPKKGQLILSIRDQSESDVGEKAYFPIRAMDYDKETKMLFTGDEMGYMNKWDLSILI
jgi:hypothetical protein